jgi:hypothetical protein
MNWKYKIDIKQYFGPANELDEDDELPSEVRISVAKELEKVWLLRNKRLELLDESSIVTVRDFNDWLDRLYDTADYHRIWLGL